MGAADTLFFETEIEWEKGRQGRLKAAQMPPIIVDAPPEFKGHEGVWTPEHLLVASLNACFMVTFLAIAENSKLTIASLRSTARGKLEKVEGAGYQITEVAIRPVVVVQSGHDLERAARLVEKAERICLISNSVKSAVRLEPEIFNEQSPASPCPPVGKSATSGRREEPDGCG